MKKLQSEPISVRFLSKILVGVFFALFITACATGKPFAKADKDDGLVFIDPLKNIADATKTTVAFVPPTWAREKDSPIVFTGSNEDAGIDPYSARVVIAGFPGVAKGLRVEGESIIIGSFELDPPPKRQWAIGSPREIARNPNFPRLIIRKSGIVSTSKAACGTPPSTDIWGKVIEAELLATEVDGVFIETNAMEFGPNGLSIIEPTITIASKVERRPEYDESMADEITLESMAYFKLTSITVRSGWTIDPFDVDIGETIVWLDGGYTAKTARLKHGIDNAWTIRGTIDGFIFYGVSPEELQLPFSGFTFVSGIGLTDFESKRMKFGTDQGPSMDFRMSGVDRGTIIGGGRLNLGDNYGGAIFDIPDGAVLDQMSHKISIGELPDKIRCAVDGWDVKVDVESVEIPEWSESENERAKITIKTRNGHVSWRGMTIPVPPIIERDDGTTGFAKTMPDEKIWFETPFGITGGASVICSFSRGEALNVFIEIKLPSLGEKGNALFEAVLTPDGGIHTPSDGSENWITFSEGSLSRKAYVGGYSLSGIGPMFDEKTGSLSVQRLVFAAATDQYDNDEFISSLLLETESPPTESPGIIVARDVKFSKDGYFTSSVVAPFSIPGTTLQVNRIELNRDGLKITGSATFDSYLDPALEGAKASFHLTMVAFSLETNGVDGIQITFVPERKPKLRDHFDSTWTLETFRATYDFSSASSNIDSSSYSVVPKAGVSSFAGLALKETTVSGLAISKEGIIRRDDTFDLQYGEIVFEYRGATFYLDDIEFTPQFDALMISSGSIELPKGGRYSKETAKTAQIQRIYVPMTTGKPTILLCEIDGKTIDLASEF